MRQICFLASCLVLTVSVAAQPVMNAPNYNVTQVTNGINASGDSMAVDARGYVYILDSQAGGPLASPDSITIVTPQGGMNQNFVNNLGTLSQIAFNPFDGFCYVAAHSPILPVVLSQVFRLEPQNGAVQVGATPLIADGFTIDDQGRWIFGTSTAVGGPGLYRHDSSSTSPTYLGPGFGTNSRLQSMAFSEDILIANAAEVRRWTPLSVGTAPYWSTAVTPNSITRVHSLARSYYDQIGKGALIGVTSFGTFCFCGTGAAFPGNATSGSNTALATESYTSPSTGLRAIATSIRGPMYWLTDTPSIATVPGKTLYRVREQDGPGIPGSLEVTAQAVPLGSVVNVDVWGPAGSPLLLGTLLAPPITPSVDIYTPFGYILNIFDPNYIPIVDGAGVFGPPNPLGVIPLSGHWQFAITLPPLGINVISQALVESPSAPNGWFFISNLVPTALP